PGKGRYAIYFRLNERAVCRKKTTKKTKRAHKPSPQRSAATHGNKGDVAFPGQFRPDHPKMRKTTKRL
ncbi:hypothetical protein, partial [Paramuribaculum intestinale]|uniref:hypothetical protein n=1 Tax=Paramuribaculum intestinale TaxID=2094151 RepID=UPI0026F3E6CD